MEKNRIEEFLMQAITIEIEYLRTVEDICTCAMRAKEKSSGNAATTRPGKTATEIITINAIKNKSNLSSISGSSFVEAKSIGA